MIRIGDFSKLSRISIRMLRHYDEIGLLEPYMVDNETGYRYYNEVQLPLAGKIQTFKNLGFELSAIRDLLETYKAPKELEQFLLEKRLELEQSVQDATRRLLLLDNTLNWLRKDGTLMGYEVTLKTLPERYVASVRQVIPAYEKEGILWKILYSETAAQKIQQANPCYGLAVFHDTGYKETDPDVEIQLSVIGSYKDTEHVKFKIVAPVQIASATYQGSYDQLTKVNEAVANWVKENGYEFNGKSLCIYHVSPADTKNPEELVTEVCFPVKKK